MIYCYRRTNLGDADVAARPHALFADSDAELEAFMSAFSAGHGHGEPRRIRCDGRPLSFYALDADGGAAAILAGAREVVAHADLMEILQRRGGAAAGVR